MVANTKDKNILKNSKLVSSSLSKKDNDIFTFNMATDDYNVHVTQENFAIFSDEINFECFKPKINIQSNTLNVGIVKNKHCFKVILNNSKIDFKDNQSRFQVKMKNGFFIVSINTSFNISVVGENVLFSGATNNPIPLEETIENTSSSNHSEIKDNNVLLISEHKNKTFLPYTANDIFAKFDSSKYNTVQEFIDNEYVISNDYYKYPIISRFKEGYKLVKYKEHGTKLKAINLGTELMFNFNLNPSIITACRNLEELNIYLDCLEENELHKFLCFDIKYEITPSKI